jgi:hypothetical protein
MRYPQSWRPVPSLAEPPEERYEYRRLYWHSWREDMIVATDANLEGRREGFSIAFYLVEIL